MPSHYSLDDIPQISLVLDTATDKVVEANQEALRLWGFTGQSDFKDKPFSRLVQMTPDSADRAFEERVPKTASVSLPDGYEMRVMLFSKSLKSDAALRFINILPLEEVLPRSFPKSTGMFSVLQGQLAMAADARQVFDAAPVGLVLIDSEYNIKRYNKKAETVFSAAERKIAGQSLGRALCCGIGAEGACGEFEGCSFCACKDAVDDVLHGGETLLNREFEFGFAGKNAAVRRYKMSIAPLSMENLQYAVAAVEDITGKPREEGEFAGLSMTDELSGILNRRGSIESLRRCIEDTVVHSSVFSLALLDIDHFKGINDTYSHGFGDEVIRVTGRLLSEKTRAVDFVGRYGGDEFMVVFPHTDAVKARRILERIRQDLKKKRIGGTNMQLAFSAGLLEISADKARSYAQDALIHKTDVLLYRAKAEGRDKILADIL